MKRLICMITLLLTGSVLYANPVDTAMARRVAEQVLGTAELVNRTAELGCEGLYHFTPSSGEGFVLVSADDCVTPVLGWSPTGEFRTDMEETQWWLRSCTEQIDDLRQQSARVSPEIAERWHTVLEGGLPPKATRIPPMLTTQWKQSPVYQQLTPFDPSTNANCLAGCGAIAMSQVMKYWNHPATGHGSHSYYTQTNNYGPLEANFDTTYAWTDMPDQLTWNHTSEEQEAVNLLLYHVGVALEMDYTPDWSNSYLYSYSYDAPCIESALATYFKYRPTLRAVDMCEYSASEWYNLMLDELKASRPVIYRGADPNRGGHIFVIDGTDYYGNFHVNWGWGGSSDGYFAIGALNTSTNVSWNLGNCAIIGIEPLAADPGSTVTVTGTAEKPQQGSVSGGGTFDAYDLAVLLATANNGYRFSHWADGCTNNPRYMISNENHTDTAYFVSAGSDTVGYCLPRYRFGYGTGGTQPTYAATCLPATRLPNVRNIAAIQLYVNIPGVYTVGIYNGDTQPDSALYTQTFTIEEYDRWVTLPFNQLVSVMTHKPVWLVMRTDDLPYSASVSRYGGNSKSLYFSYNGINWSDYHRELGHISLMMRAIFANGTHAAIDPVDALTGTELRIDGLAVSAETTTDGDLALYDITGRMLCHSRGKSLHFTAPAAGVYLLRVGQQSTKLVLK